MSPLLFGDGPPGVTTEVEVYGGLAFNAEKPFEKVASLER
jgi:hypothetical protein